MWLIILIILCIVWLYYKVVKPYKHWEEKGIPYLKPIPFLGNMGWLVFRKRSSAEASEDMYKTHPEQRYIGLYQFLQPTILLRDPELIKQMTVKDFDAFPEHQLYVPEGLDPLWDKNLFGMKGNSKWHDMRTTLSPAFTSSKMKMMFDLMKVCSRQLTNHFQKQDGLIEVEMKDVLSRFANDVIGSAAFGVTCDSLQNPDNEFYEMGSNLTDFTGLRSLVFFGYTVSPTLMKLLKICIIRPRFSTFFRGIIKEAIKVRKEKGIIRPDMIHLLMEAQKGRLKQDENDIDAGFAAVEDSDLGKSQKAEITDEDITAQGIVFFFAGFDTASSLMSFTCYELAVNLDIQEQLRNEVLDTLKTCKGDITYEALMGMKYLDMVISEALRKWPPVEIVDRHCVKPYTIPSKLPGEKSLNVDVDTMLWIPVYALHRDPEHYPNPTKFDPERFSEENKKNIKPFTYIPFGCGRRSCIGSRFALLETKLIIFELLSKFEIVPVAKTQIPLKLRKGSVSMTTEKGITLGLKSRK